MSKHRLIGRVVSFWLDGHRSGRVTRVRIDRRGMVAGVTVTLPSYSAAGKLTYTGPRVRLDARHFAGPLTGELYRADYRPVPGLGGFHS